MDPRNSRGRKPGSLSLKERQAIVRRNQDRIWTPEMREKVAASIRGTKQSPECIEKKRLKSLGNRSRTGQQLSLETRKLISQSNLGKHSGSRSPHTMETRRKISMGLKGNRNRQGTVHSVETKVKIITALHRAGNSFLRGRSSSLEIAVHKILDSMGIEYVTHKRIGYYVADILILNRRLVIECDGTYWHSRPGAAERDSAKDIFLESQNYIVRRIPEKEIKKNVCKAVREALK